MRGDGAAVVDDVFSECAGVEDRVRDLKCSPELPRDVGDATADVSSGVAADGAVDDRDTPGFLNEEGLLMPPPASSWPAELPFNVLLRIITWPPSL